MLLRGFGLSLQKRFATPAFVNPLQGHGILQRFLEKTLQNTRNVMPARHTSGQINSDPLNSSGSFLGIFENKAMSVEEIEGKLTYPVKIIGTRKPYRFWFYEWDFNAAFIRDFLNPRLYLTFQDSKGTIVGPVAYNATFISWGPKVEFGLRNRFGYLGALKDICLPSIPKRLDMGVGWDYGWCVANIGVLRTTVSFQDSALRMAQGDSKTNLQVTYVGFGSAFGVTRINSGGHYTRLPYLFTPYWNAKQWAFVLFGNFASTAMAVFLIFLFPEAFENTAEKLDKMTIQNEEEARHLAEEPHTREFKRSLVGKVFAFVSFVSVSFCQCVCASKSHCTSLSPLYHHHLNVLL